MRAPLAAAALFVGGTAVAGRGMTGHMAAHMAAVALAAPLLALGLRPRTGPIGPLAASLVELAAVWTWHLPALRHAVGHGPAALLGEQVVFLIAGTLLWSAVLARPAQGVGALLLTSMHMTLLGALIGLAPRPLYAMDHGAPFGLDPLADQQLGGAIMLLLGGASYLLGALAVLATLLRTEAEPA